MLRTPAIIVNYKTYKQGYGKGAEEMTRVLHEVAQESGVSIAAAVCPTDIRHLASKFDVPILAQHIDPVGFGSFTGHVLPESVLEAGAVGTLINHSERRLRLADIEANVSKCRELGLVSIVCTNNIQTSVAAAAMEPDFVAVEPPELIGGDISVSTAQPELVEGSVSSVKKVAPAVKVLCGAGVKNGGDVRKALELGSEGVLLASGVVKAKDVRTIVEDLVSGIR